MAIIYGYHCDMGPIQSLISNKISTLYFQAKERV